MHPVNGGGGRLPLESATANKVHEVLLYLLDAWFRVGFSLSKLMNRTLYMQVLDYDRFSRDDPIGEVCIPFSELDLSTSQTLWRNLQPCKGHSVSNDY